MGPGMFDDLYTGLYIFIAIVALIMFGAGYGCSKGCDYVKAHYSVKIEKKP